jgi:hypothetical protein
VDDYVLDSGLETISEIRAGQPEALLPTLHYLIAVVDGIIKNFFAVSLSAFVTLAIRNLDRMRV